MLTVDDNEIVVVEIGRDSVRCIYNDELKPLIKGLSGDAMPQISRASHVEPLGDKWQADMSPVGGPVLGPFELHGEAIKAEQEWLIENHFGLPLSYIR